MNYCTFFCISIVKYINLKLQMNQTEIRKYNTSYQATCSDNSQNISLSNQSSAITVIKGNSYETNRDKTPKADISLKNNSSSKMIRVSSSKGINVISIRPQSSQKQVKQFSSANNISIGGSSETTIKIQDPNLMQLMKQQIKKAVQIYEDKMNQEISYQHNYLTVQVERLKQLLIINQSKLAQQNQQLGELLSRVEIVQRKVQAKTNLMIKQIAQFKRFYDQCYNYTVRRIADAEISMKSVAKYVEEETSTLSSVESWKYVEYANSLVKSIVATCSAQSSSLKYYLDQEIFELELDLGKFHEKYQQIDKIVYEMKSTKFSNESLKDSIKDLGKFAIVTNNLRKDQHKQNFLEYYEPKFKQIIKRVNNSTIQIDLIKGLIQTDIQSLAHTAKLQQLTNKITSLQAKMEEQKSRYQKQLANKQQILSQSNPRILELETKLHANIEQQAKLLNQISQLKQKVSYYQTKCEKNSERQYGIQSTMAQAFAQTLVKQKTKKFIEQRSTLTQKISCLQQKIQKLDHQNYLLAQKLSKTQDIRIQNAKLDTQLKYTSKLLQQYEQNQHKQDKSTEEIKKQNICLLATVQDMKGKIKMFEDRIQGIMRQNKQINRDDDQYFKELEEEVEKCYRDIEKLESINMQVLIRNKQLLQRNQTLEQDLHHYAQTFEKQSITFRTALQNLQKQKDHLTLQNNKLSQQTKSLKQDIENTRTIQSFYQNNSNISLQLRKTVSSDLTGCMTNLHCKTPKKKVQRKTFSSKEKEEGDGKIEELRSVLRKMGCMFPVVCGIDQNGYLRDQRTGCYFVDSRQNYFLLGQEELTEAVKNGLILL